jgi:5-methylcytosine-specific restriction enzyme subunit McrC
VDLRLFPQLNTDVAVESADRCVVIDTKFTSRPFETRYGSLKLRTEHLYQLHAYVTNFAARKKRAEVEGLLIYPTVSDDLRLLYQVMGYRLRVASLNLNQAWHMVGSELLSLVSESGPFLPDNRLTDSAVV